MQRKKRWLFGTALSLSLLLGGTGTALAAGPNENASCIGQLSVLLTPQGRDDIQLVHNQIYKEILGAPPGQGFVGIAQSHGALTNCLQHIPPGLVVPPHP